MRTLTKAIITLLLAIGLVRAGMFLLWWAVYGATKAALWYYGLFYGLLARVHNPDVRENATAALAIFCGLAGVAIIVILFPTVSEKVDIITEDIAEARSRRGGEVTPE